MDDFWHFVFITLLIATVVLKADSVPLEDTTPPKQEYDYDEEGVFEYIIDYENTDDGPYFMIKDPCVKIMKSTGSSMEPCYDYHDLVLIDICYDPSELEVGDVVAYFEGEEHTIHHRIIEIDHEKKWFRTQGDNNDYPDDFSSFDNLYGKTIGVLNVYEG